MSLHRSSRGTAAIMRLVTRAAAAVCLIVSAQAVLAPGAQADTPPTPVAEFTAPMCPGDTTWDPHNALGPVPDLTQVFGERLDAYNAGGVVPLYDSDGVGINTFPPMCSVRYDETTGGPVAQWTFCTNHIGDTCTDTDADGGLVQGPDEIDPMQEVAGNPRLTADQQSVIGYLIQHGHDFLPVAHPGLSEVTEARSDRTPLERTALQYLIWCVSDPLPVNSPDPFAQLCAANVDDAEQARLLALVPDTSLLQVDYTGAAGLRVGQTARFAFTTNLHEQVIKLRLSGVAVSSLRVCSGDATLSRTRLVVHGDDAAVTSEVTLCARVSGVGRVRLAASTSDSSTVNLHWHQSPNAPVGVLCQVFATFDTVGGTLRAQDSTRVGAVAPTVTTQASRAVVKPGAELFDTVIVRGLRPSYTGAATASLYGPFESRDEAVCTAGTLVRTVGFDAENGRQRTGTVRVHKPGYYTWVARLSADGTHAAASHRCGQAAETTLNRRTPYRVPDIEAGFAGRVDDKRAAGTLSFRGIGAGSVATQLTGLSGGEMLLPGSVDTVAMLDRGARPGEAIGTVVIAGHVSDDHNRPGALFGLKDASVGQRVSFTSTSGVTTVYRVDSIRSYDRGHLPRSAFATAGQSRLALVTCTGIVWDGSRFHYTKNLVVTATAVR